MPTIITEEGTLSAVVIRKIEELLGFANYVGLGTLLLHLLSLEFAES
ncbi:hypothetical protein GEOBRER4_n3046 [Citrifermentans bremense]|uniref:Uncharacterized protein n=1 Tax=Citrifermentans bremense TaxID=60035 RepID=A0A7R7FSG6_9BACT|nr:hypothetical protein GEOBRER4_n3046 [Citrifermentans bremense]